MSLHMVRPLSSLPLEEAGSLDAPKGSPAWALAMRVELRQMWQDGTTQLRRFQQYLTLLEQHKGYQQLDDAFGHPFPSLRAFCTAQPPHGLGYDPGMLEALQAETREMALGQKIAEVQALEKHGTNQHTDGGHSHANVHPGANTRYYIARLKRDHPEISAALAAGKFTSVRAAAKAAGFVHDPTPLTMLHRYWRQVAPDDRLRFLTEMLTPTERRALSLGLDDEKDTP